MYGSQELDRSLLGKRVFIRTDMDEGEEATVVRTTISGMIKVRTDDGEFLWGNQYDEV
ncbi:MAG: hypothetical protein V3V96_15455 [Acidiferrobacterales bacterium]